jgi:SAM-dependent methyltransferase
MRGQLRCSARQNQRVHAGEQAERDRIAPRAVEVAREDLSSDTSGFQVVGTALEQLRVELTAECPAALALPAKVLGSPLLRCHNRSLPGGDATRRRRCVAHRGMIVGVWHPYDEMGEAYLQHAAFSPYNALYDRPAVLKLVGSVDGLDVLDAGCGPGLYSEELVRRGGRVTGMDASEAQLAIARSRLDAGTRLVRAALGEPLPFVSASFHVVVCALVIHYVANLDDAFGEFFRVLRPGGRVVLSTQHPSIDWMRKGGSYFDVRQEEDVWKTPAGPQLVTFWRVPLTRLCAAATDNGLLISRLVEPLPDPAMRDQSPDDWEQLTTRPGFLILELLKPREL